MALGFSLIWQYEWTPGNRAKQPQIWPKQSRLSLDDQKPTVIMFVHPRCPCSRASMAEFERLLAVCKDHAKFHVLCLQPKDNFSDWKNSDIWRRASELPNVTTTADVDGREARLFGVSVSGHVVLYQTSGELGYSGGITESRGHEGSNPGKLRLQQLILDRQVTGHSWQVYGCPLY